MSIRAFISSATSNRSVIEHRSVSLWPQIGFFIISLIMISVPFLVGRFSVNEAYFDANYPGFAQDFQLALQTSGCHFRNDESSSTFLECVISDRVIHGEHYTIYILPSQDREFASQAIIFFPQSMRVTRGVDQILEGPYLFGTTDFASILVDMDDDEFNTTPQRYAMNILRNLDLNSLPSDVLFIYMSIAIQYSFYLLVISFMIWWLYLKRGFVKLPFREVTDMMVVIMFWTALPTALLGLFAPVVASVVFTVGYVTRIIFLYTKLTRMIRV